MPVTSMLVMILSLSAMSGGNPAPQSARLDANCGSQQREIEDWVVAHYSDVLDIVLPVRGASEEYIPKHVRWTVAVRISPPYEGSEELFVISNQYNGTVELCFKRPKGSSIRAQLRELKEMHPGANLETLSQLVRIEQHVLTLRDMPWLQELAHEFEQIRFSPVLPDEFALDETGYRFWSQSQWGQWMEIQLEGPGPGASKQPHPLLEWIEKVRSLVLIHVQKSEKR